MNDEINNVDIIEYIISEESKGLRADQAIANENIQFSRSLVQKWIKKGNITVNNKIIKPKDILNENDKVTIIPEENINSNFIKPEEIFIKVEYEDQAVVESVCKGMKSRFYDSGRYSPKHEKGVHYFHSLLSRYI